MAHYLIINTGGTIGMVDGPHGLEPKAGEIEKALASTNNELKAWQEHQITWQHWQPLLDSSELQPAHWLILRDAIKSHANVDGVLIIHGTDTLSYTAAALSFLLANSTIPIVITGSMLPVSAPNTDAISNLALSLIALKQNRREVVIAVGGQILPASRASKTSTQKHAAFEAPGWLPEQWVETPPTTPMPRLEQFSNKPVVVFTLYPGVQANLLMSLIEQQPSAIIINAFGNGNSASDPHFKEALQQAQLRNIPVFVRSQCLEADVDFSIYAAGDLFASAGAISCGTMPFEAVLTKLQILTSLYLDSKDVIHGFMKPFAREWQR